MSLYLGFDTSNYTTSVALYDSVRDEMHSARKLLDVGKGSIGLRQSDALFHHISNLAGLVEELSSRLSCGVIEAAAASEYPREVKGSYMPCFLAGKSHAKTVASLIGIPYYAFSHQQGHIAAGAWSAGKPELLETEFLAFHVSGGTTELLHVVPDAKGRIAASRIGGSSDLAAGQLVDRCGHLLGLGFPAGPEIEKLAEEHTSEIFFVPKSAGLEFSLSGLENKVKELHNSKEFSSNIAFFVIKSITEVLCGALNKACGIYKHLPVLCVGGVMSNEYIRSQISGRFNAVFAAPGFSSDNAAGIAYLAWKSHKEGGDALAER